MSTAQRFATFSNPSFLNCGQVTYKTGAAAPKVADVPKWVMPTEVYSARPSTVLAYKKAHQVGRFDPAAPEILEQKVAQMWKEVEERGSLDFHAVICLSQSGSESCCSFCFFIPI